METNWKEKAETYYGNFRGRFFDWLHGREFTETFVNFSSQREGECMLEAFHRYLKGYASRTEKSCESYADKQLRFKAQRMQRRATLREGEGEDGQWELTIRGEFRGAYTDSPELPVSIQTRKMP